MRASINFNLQASVFAVLNQIPHGIMLHGVTTIVTPLRYTTKDGAMLFATYVDANAGCKQPRLAAR